MMRRASRISALSVAVLAAPALAQPVPDYDFDWATIGDPGNRPANAQEAPFLHPPASDLVEIGDVDYEYRMTRTEVTVGQWFEFVDAYWPHNDERIDLSAFTSYWIRPQNPNPGPGEDPQYTLVHPDAASFPADMSWYYAARYVNWLHNDKVNEKWAFETGVYDTSTFGGVDAQGNPTDQHTRNPDAKFWIPSMDEWAKGMYWDPDKHGPGEGGYWLRPDSGDEMLISAPPDMGGETNAGEYFVTLDPDERWQYFSVGQYPDVQSPWGLLDGSGGVSEWNEDRSPTPSSDERIWQGSWFLLEFTYLKDRLDNIAPDRPTSSQHGLRLASAVPAPNTCALSLVCLAFTSSRRKR
ncbi:MAG: SUMF1/EgtB/PvdO family nonheme iron enzyme [Phycisphaerales bacterium JB037]